ncbi:MAG TPA: hypothetical protein VG816_08145, partial [Solirubrobacterales bacterium]|nr:hypothetical protein [Solirubrobacterales bacterium]
KTLDSATRHPRRGIPCSKVMPIKPVFQPFDSHSPWLFQRRTSFAMLLTGAVALVLLAAASPALARVHFDPESPAGKEYALPLDQARDEAAGAGKSDGPAGKKAQLFGEGISKQTASSGSGANGGGGGKGSDRTGAGTNGDDSELPSQAPRQLGAAVVAVSSNTDSYALSSAILWIAAILALGGLVALALRVARRSPHA